jgi:hypothetical protein
MCGGIRKRSENIKIPISIFDTYRESKSMCPTCEEKVCRASRSEGTEQWQWLYYYVLWYVWRRREIHTIFWQRNLKERRNLEGLSIDERIMLKCFLNK